MSKKWNQTTRKQLSWSKQKISKTICAYMPQKETKKEVAKNNDMGVEEVLRK